MHEAIQRQSAVTTKSLTTSTQVFAPVTCNSTGLARIEAELKFYKISSTSCPEIAFGLYKNGVIVEYTLYTGCQFSTVSGNADTQKVVWYENVSDGDVIDFRASSAVNSSTAVTVTLNIFTKLVSVNKNWIANTLSGSLSGTLSTTPSDIYNLSLPKGLYRINYNACFNVEQPNGELTIDIFDTVVSAVKTIKANRTIAESSINNYYMVTLSDIYIESTTDSTLFKFRMYYENGISSGIYKVAYNISYERVRV